MRFGIVSQHSSSTLDPCAAGASKTNRQKNECGPQARKKKIQKNLACRYAHAPQVRQQITKEPRAPYGAPVAVVIAARRRRVMKNIRKKQKNPWLRYLARLRAAGALRKETKTKKTWLHR